MNKEDILQKSRNENKNGDEMEQKIKLRSYAISSAIGAIICMMLVFVENVIFNRNASLIWIIYSSMFFSKSILNAIKLKKRFDIGLSILWGLVFIAYTVVYILENIGW